MKDTFYILISILCVALIVLFIWNIVLYKNNRRTKKEEYLELKYKQQFYIAVFTTIIAVMSFMGYDKYSEIENKITSEIEAKNKQAIDKYKLQVDSIAKEVSDNQKNIDFENELLKESNKHLSYQTEKANEMLFSIMYKFADMKNDLNTSKFEVDRQIEKVKGFDNDIKELKKIEFLKQVHLVTGRYFEEGKTLKYVDTVYFDKLRTIDGNNLPLFKTPPSVILSKITGVDIFIDNITNKYFVLAGGGMVSKISETEEKSLSDVRYDLLIIYKDSQ